MGRGERKEGPSNPLYGTGLKRPKKPRPSASTEKDGVLVWRLDGELHCEEGPAVKYPDGSWEWYRHGKIHRDDGPAVFIKGPWDDETGQFWEPRGYKSEPEWRNDWGWADETQIWFHDGVPHREDGPAVVEVGEAGILNGKAYMREGKLHCEDGPAYERLYEDGDHPRRYFLNGEELSEEEWARRTGC